MIRYRGHVLALMFLMALVLSLFPTASTALHAQPPGKDIYQDFRGRKPLAAEWKMIPPNHDAFTKFEDEGLRITIPKTRLSDQPIGVRLTFPVSGDFELTAGYELLSLEKPPPGGTGVGIALNLIAQNNANKKFAKLGRFLLPKEGDAYVAECTVNDSPKNNQWKSAPTTATAGQLKLIRAGSELRYLVAEPPANEFREILRAEFTADDLEIVRLGVNNNKSPAAADVRIVDLKIRLVPAAKLGDPVAPPRDEEATPPWRRLTVALVVGIAAILLLAITVGLVAVMRNRRGTAPAAKSDAAAAKSEPSAASVAFTCSECGKPLKAKAALAGKNIKCPQCGKTVLVPEA